MEALAIPVMQGLNQPPTVHTDSKCFLQAIPSEIQGRDVLIKTYKLDNPQAVSSILRAEIDYASLSSHLCGSVLSTEVSKGRSTPYEVKVTLEKSEEGDWPAWPESESEDQPIPVAKSHYSRTEDLFSRKVFKTKTFWLGQPVVQKCFTSGTLDYVNFAIKEALLQRKVENCYTCRLLDFSFDKPVGKDFEVWLTMESLDRDLSEDITIRQNSVYPEKELVSIFSCVSEALMIAKLEGVAHLDIKPGNIFLLEHNYCKIGDFGSAQRASDNVKGDGTGYYLSPEMRLLLQGNPVQVNCFQSDVFSLGVTFLHAAKLTLPKAVSDARSMMDLEAAVEAELTANFTYSEELKALLREMLNFDPLQRPTIEEVTIRLKHYSSFGLGEPSILGVIPEVELLDSAEILTRIDECIYEENIDLSILYGVQYLCQHKTEIIEHSLPLEACLLIAKASTHSGRYTEVRKVLDSVLDSKGRTADCPEVKQEMWKLLGSLFLSEGRLAEARISFKKANDLLVEAGKEVNITLEILNELMSTLAGSSSCLEQMGLIFILAASLWYEGPSDSYVHCFEAALKYNVLQQASMAEDMLHRAIAFKAAKCAGNADLEALCRLMKEDYHLAGRPFEMENPMLSTVAVNWKQVGWQGKSITTLNRLLADAYASQGKWLEAEELIIKVIFCERRLLGDGNPSLMLSVQVLVYICESQNRDEDSQKILTKFIELSKKCEEFGSNLAHFYFRLGKLHQNQKKLSDAINLYNKALEIKNTFWQEYYFDISIQVSYNLAEVYMAQGDLENAEKTYKQVLRLCCNKRDLNAKRRAYQSLAALYKQQQSVMGWKNYIKTKQILQNTREFEVYTLFSRHEEQPFSDRHDAYFSLAVLLKQEGRFNKAVKYFQRVIQALEPSENRVLVVDTYVELADCYQLQQQVVETGVFLRKALEVVEKERVEFRDLAYLYNSLVDLYARPDMFSELEKDFEPLCPGRMQAYHIAALIYFSQGNMLEGLYAISTLCSEMNEEHDLHNNIITSILHSVSLCKSGEWSKAKEALDHGIGQWQTQEDSSNRELLITENRFLVLGHLLLAKGCIDHGLPLGQDYLCAAAFMWALSEPIDLLLVRTYSQLLSDTQQHHCEVEGVTRRALEQTEEVANNPLTMGCVYLLLAWRNLLEHQFAAAEEVCSLSIKVLGTIQDREGLAIARCALADIYAAQNKLREAMGLWLSAGKEVEMVQAHFTALLTQTDICSGNIQAALEKSPAEITHEGFAKAYYFIGWLYYYENQLQEAIQCLNWSLEVHKQLGLGESVVTAYCYQMLGKAYRALGPPQSALPSCILALRLLTQHYGASHAYTARSCLELARIYQEVGNASEAQSLYLRGVAVLESEPEKDQELLTEAYVQLSRLSSQIG